MSEQKLTIKEDDLDASIVFGVRDCSNILEIQSTGRILVRGNVIADDVEVYEALRVFINGVNWRHRGKK